MLIKHFEVERQRSVGHRKTGGRGCEMPWELKGKSRWGWGVREKQPWGAEGEMF